MLSAGEHKVAPWVPETADQVETTAESLFLQAAVSRWGSNYATTRRPPAERRGPARRYLSGTEFFKNKRPDGNTEPSNVGYVAPHKSAPIEHSHTLINVK